jgi:hypothetical protein
MNMGIFSADSSAGRYGIGLGVLWMVSSTFAQAITQEIRAEFRPDSAQPHRNVFVNKTPVSGYCAEFPSQCLDNNMFSIRLPVQFNSIGKIYQGVPVSIKVPANWRSVVVRNRDTQETETLEVRISGIGSTYVLSQSAASLVGITDILQGHRQLWDHDSWVYAPAPCEYSGVGAYGPDFYRFFWKTPQEARCTKTARFMIPSMRFEYLDFAYELRTPNPLGMSAGTYTGQLTYRLGPNGDFDLSNQMEADDELLVLDFNLNVEHTLKVDVPPGGTKVELVPKGGWQSWLQSGRSPTRLFRDQTFLISASSKFTMRLECEHQIKQGCGIIAAGYGGLVNVSVSLPGGLTDETGKPVKNFALSQQESIRFQPGHYIDRQPGTLHFEMPPGDTSWLISNNKGLPYKGNITVIWDSDI